MNQRFEQTKPILNRTVITITPAQAISQPCLELFYPC